MRFVQRGRAIIKALAVVLSLALPDLPTGQWRVLTVEECKSLLSHR